MAILGFHIVVSLIVLTVISKLGTRLSIVQLYIINGLYRFIAPSNNELRSLLPQVRVEKNARKRQKQQQQQDLEGFNVPKASPFQLKLAPVNEQELASFPFYTSIHWLSLFVPLACLVYALSEGFAFLFPGNNDTNISVLWLIIAVAFVMQVLARLTAWLLLNEDERGLLISFAALYFLISCIFSMFADRFLDIHLLSAYDRFGENVVALLREADPSAPEARPQSPLLLYISLSVMFSFLSAMLVFPNFRYATMYVKSLQVAGKPVKLLLHLSFLLPALSLLLFCSPVKEFIVNGPRKLLTAPQVDIVRVYISIAAVLLRLGLRRIHLQSHLDLSYEKVQQLQQQTGRVKNTELQSMVFRYYSYFCAACVQYFSPVLLSFFFALLLKTTGNLSWLGAELSEQSSTGHSASMAAFRAVFDAEVCRAVWSFALVITTFINFSLSLVGVIYNTYFV